MNFPAFDPVILQIGPLAIRWYSIAYIAGIILGCFYINWLNLKAYTVKNLKPYDDFMVAVIFGVVIGGRIGYVLFYNPGYYLSNPLEILKVWQGGMSFHGGLVGSIVAIFLHCRKNNFPKLAVWDLCAAAAPIGLFFGRIANFINGELYGRVTDSKWGMIFPSGGNLPRHPSQLYEAVLEGALLFIIIFIVANFTKARSKPGLISGLFLCGYAAARMLVENFREPDEQLGFFFGHITMGQLLSTPMVLIGVFLIYNALHRKERNES